MRLKQWLKRRITLQMLCRSPFFDEKWYREKTGISGNIDAAAHYLDGGWRTCSPSVRFRQDQYLEANQDVREAQVCPLAHYLLDGRKQHRLLYPGMIESHYHRYFLFRSVKRRFFELIHFRRIARNRSARLLVIVHIYYEESAEEILEYLKNLRPYHYDLVVTTTEDRNTELIRQTVFSFRKDAVFCVFPNCGFDIGPFLAVLTDCDLSQYDLVFKLHSKRHFPREGVIAGDVLIRGGDWFTALFRSVLGARWVHLNIDRLMNDRQLSLIAAKNLLWQDPPRKEQLTVKKLASLGLEIPSHYTFVAGSCFAARASRIPSAGEHGISAEDFGVPVRGAFTPAHALERYLTGSIPDAEKHGNPVCRTRQRVNRLLLRRRLKKNRNQVRQMMSEEPDLLDPFSAGTERSPGPEQDVKEKPLTVAFAVTETGPNAVAGDYFTAKEMAEALKKRGVRCLFAAQKEPDGEWYRLTPEVDVLISMLQHYDPQNIRNDSSRLIVAGWARNWFDAWMDNPWTEEYDLLLASSRTACGMMRERLGREVFLLPIATNPDRFCPPEEAGRKEDEEACSRYECDYCFSGNHFGSPREIETELDPEALPYRLNLYGKGWDRNEKYAPWWRGHLSYDELAEAYRYTRIVLDDATPSTREAGSVNSRVFDAIAAGCLVLTNNEAGAKETFRGLLPTFNSKESLEKQLKLYLEDEQLRKEKAEELRRFVLENHTYEIRAGQLLSILQKVRGERERLPDANPSRDVI